MRNPPFGTRPGPWPTGLSRPRPSPTSSRRHPRSAQGLYSPRVAPDPARAGNGEILPDVGRELLRLRPLCGQGGFAIPSFNGYAATMAYLPSRKLSIAIAVTVERRPIRSATIRPTSSPTSPRPSFRELRRGFGSLSSAGSVTGVPHHRERSTPLQSRHIAAKPLSAAARTRTGSAVSPLIPASVRRRDREQVALTRAGWAALSRIALLGRRRWCSCAIAPSPGASRSSERAQRAARCAGVGRRAGQHPVHQREHVRHTLRQSACHRQRLGDGAVDPAPAVQLHRGPGEHRDGRNVAAELALRFTEQNLVRLGNHPEVAVCPGCAHWLHRRAHSGIDAGPGAPRLLSSSAGWTPPGSK